MNLFNRVLILALALVLVVVGLMTFLVTIDLVGPTALPLPGSIEDLFAKAAGLTGHARTQAIIISLVLAIVSTALVLLELLPLKRTKAITVEAVEGGTLTIATKSISKMAAAVAKDIEGVIGFKGGVVKTKEGIIIACKGVLESGANMLEVGKTIQDEVKEAIEANTGLTVIKVDLDLKLAASSTRSSGADYI